MELSPNLELFFYDLKIEFTNRWRVLLNQFLVFTLQQMNIQKPTLSGDLLRLTPGHLGKYLSDPEFATLSDCEAVVKRRNKMDCTFPENLRHLEELNEPTEPEDM